MLVLGWFKLIFHFIMGIKLISHFIMGSISLLIFMLGVLVSQGCCNKLSQTWQLKKNKNPFSHSLDRCSKSRCKVTLPLKSQGENSSFPLSTSSDLGTLWPVAAKYPSNLCLYLHWLSTLIPVCFFYEDTSLV